MERQAQGTHDEGRCFLSSDKRSQPRVATEPLAVKIFGECQRTYGYIRDISRTGLQLRTFMFCSSEPKKVGEKISIEFAVPDCDLTIACRAEVVWNRTPEYGPQTLNIQGVSFVEIDDTVQQRLGECVRARLFNA